jgi:hypothetical protein
MTSPIHIHLHGKTKDVTSRPLASWGLRSYRCKGPYGWIMIGAKDPNEAMGEAKRSNENVKRENLQEWNGTSYVPV